MSASSSNLALEDGCVPTKVVIQLATQVVIPNYSRDFASIPLQDFKPSYLAMDDGSLLATPLISDFQGALLSLIILSVLLALFLRNVVVAGYYYFSRSKIIHDRRLFLALFLSQLVSPAGILPTMVSYFDRSGDCTVILRLERCIQFFSLSMLIYVVLGFKAYRVLEDSRAVLVVATILQLGATAVFGLELAGTEGHRRLSGSCNRNRIPITMVGSVSIQLAQVLFIAICFGIAILRARAETRGTTGEKRTPKPASPITKAAEKLGATGWLGQSAAQTPPRNSVVSRLTWVFPGMFDTLFHQVMRDELRFTCMIAVTSGVAIVFPLIGLNCKNGLSVQGWLCLPWCFISLVVIKTFDRALARHEEEVAQWMSPIPTTAGYSKETANGHSTSTLEFTPASELGGSSTASSNPFEDPHRLSTRSSAQLSYSTSIYATETEHSYTDSAYEVVEAHRSSSEKILSR